MTAFVTELTKSEDAYMAPCVALNTEISRTLLPRAFVATIRLFLRASWTPAGGRSGSGVPAAVYVGMTIPMDPAQVVTLFTMVGRALAWFRWKAYLAPEHDAGALMLTPFGQQYFDRRFRMNPRASACSRISPTAQ